MAGGVGYPVENVPGVIFGGGSECEVENRLGAIEFGTSGEQVWGFQKRFDGLGDLIEFPVVP